MTSAARERFLGIMHAQATRMARLIDDLLSLSRVELSAHVRPDTLVDIVPIIRQVVDGLEPLARERQVEIEIDLPETPVLIAGDREELLRLFENLIENALKYGASGGKVIVSLTSASSGEGAPEYRVMVRDFGPGIAPEHLPRLTERFYRVDVGDSRAQGGTGLGFIPGEAYPCPSSRPAADRKRAEKRRDVYRLFSPDRSRSPSPEIQVISMACRCHPTVIKPS